MSGQNASCKLPAGEYQFADCLDDGAPVCVRIILRKNGATFDFTGSGPVNSNALNANQTVVQSALLYCLRCLVNEDIPLNSGMLAPIKLIVPAGMLNAPVNPDPTKHAAIIGGNTELSQRVVDIILGALGLAAASQGTMNNIIFGNDTFGFYETIYGGCGAGPNFDNASAVHSHMTNTQITDVEVYEKRYPVRIKQFAIRRGSGGNGLYRGGNGVIREIEFLLPLQVSLLTQRWLKSPFGLNGGAPGKPGRNLFRRKNEKSYQVLPPLAQFTVAPGDSLCIHTPGGGGFGSVRNAE